MGRMEERLYNTIKSHFDSIDLEYEEHGERLAVSFTAALESKELSCISYVDSEFQVFGTFSVLEYELARKHREEILWLINEINSSLSVGRFFYSEEDSKIRCVIESTYDESLISKSVVADMLVFLFNNAASIEKAIVGLNEGEITKEQSLDLYYEHELLLSNSQFIDNTDKVYNVLCDAFDSIEYSYERRPENMSIVFSSTGDDEPVGYSIRTMRDFKAIRLVAYVCDADAKNEKTMLDAVNCANNNIGIGSFELSSGSIYYVSNLFFAESLISKESVLDLFRMSMEICDELNDKFDGLNKGTLSIEEFKEFFE